MGVKGAAEKSGSDGISKNTALLCLKFKIGFVRSEVHRLPTAVEFKRPGAGLNAGFKLELTG
tara:strand:+ start:648 stop:833 length:186 start_codon:yes stop_codon:yes gene_type:complete